MKDKIIKKLIESEKSRQKKQVNLIASENYVSSDVLTALGSEFTNKYSEGYPGKRYYSGNKHVDELETLTQLRALKLFNLSSNDWSVNVQTLSGATANLALYSALVPIGGKIMSMDTASGGHLSHAQKVSFTGKIWKQINYSVNEKTGLLDYDSLEKIALAEKPNMIVAGFTAYSREIDFKKIATIAKKSGALFHVDISHIAGIVASGFHVSPFKYADTVMTTTHKTLRGPRSALIFSRKDLSMKIDKAVFPGLFGGPHNNQIAAVAVALNEAHSAKFKKYIAQCLTNAKTLANELKLLGWKIISGGTDTHLFIVDTFGSIGLSGKESTEALEAEDILVNMNLIPHDTRSALDPSGIRIGTPAMTTMGWKSKDMISLGRKIDKILRTKIKQL